MFLEYGVNEHNVMVHISNTGRGRVALSCPYCGMGLIARKGKKLAHHFAHDGETCREVATREGVQLPAYDSFGLSLSGRDWQLLQDFHLRGYTPYGSKERLEQLKLITYSPFAGRGGDWLLTDLGKVPFGEATLSKFANIQSGLLADQHEKLETYLERAKTLADKKIALADLQMYRSQFQRVLSCSLYFLEIKHDEGKLYKIGVTGRDLPERIAELERGLTPHFGKVEIKALRVLKNQGSIEHYFKLRYKNHVTAVGDYTEYFEFPNRRNVLSDLTRLGNRQLTELEQSILKGKLSGTAAQLKAEIKEDERREAIRDGMAAAAAQGKHIGRPTGSSEKEDAFLAKYPEVVKALKQGLSLRKTATKTKVSVNTVRKVKVLYEIALLDKIS